MRQIFILLLLSCCLSGLPDRAVAHEIRPAYLSLTEHPTGKVEVTWKVPTKGELVLSLAPVFPDFCADASAPTQQMVPGAVLRQWSLHCQLPLRDSRLSIDGLESTLTDVLVQIVDRDGDSHSARLTPSRNEMTVPGRSSDWDVVATYLKLGVEHILLGFDHLLFVLALLLIVRSVRALIATITAFTLAHSITLACAALGLLTVPTAPVEAVIALSIVFLAMEIVHAYRGRIGLAAKRPWLVAFTFGLLHGLGFAGALTQIGLPGHAIPLALFSFNIGVEIGQLLFVTVVLLITHLGGRLLSIASNHRFRLLLAYLIGTVAAYWTLQRVSGF